MELYEVELMMLLLIFLIKKIKVCLWNTMHTKYEVSIFYGSKVTAKVKVDNRQTDKQIDRQDKNNMPPIIRSGA